MISTSAQKVPNGEKRRGEKGSHGSQAWMHGTCWNFDTSLANVDFFEIKRFVELICEYDDLQSLGDQHAREEVHR